MFSWKAALILIAAGLRLRNGAGGTILVVLAVTLMAGGCRLVYLPPSAQAPLFTHGGEVSAAALTGSEMFEGQIAYSPIDRFGVLGSVMYNRNGSDSAANRYRYADLQAEYYIASPSGMRIEIIGGVGRGESKPTRTPSSGTCNEGTFFRYLLQGNFGYSRLNDFSPHDGDDSRFPLEFAAAIRAVYVSFDRLDQIDFNAIDDQGMPLPPVVTHLPNRSALIFEPAFVVRFGTPTIQGETQIGFADESSEDIDFFVNPVYFSLGLRIALR